MPKFAKILLGTCLGLCFIHSAVATADIAPPPHAGRKVLKCAEIAADASGEAPDQAQLRQFLSNHAYSSVGTPEITKEADGSFQVCAVFTR